MVSKSFDLSKRALNAPSRRDVLKDGAAAVLGLTAVFVLIVLAGHPESAALGAVFAAALLAGRRAIGDLPRLRRETRAIAVAAATALGLTAFLLIPSILAIGASARLAAAARPYWADHLSLAPHGPIWPAVLPEFFPHTLGNGTWAPTVAGGTGTFVEMARDFATTLMVEASWDSTHRFRGRPRLCREAQDVLYENNFQDSHLVSGSKTRRDLADLERRNVQPTTITIEFLQQHDEGEFLNRRARLQELMTRKQ